MWVIQLEQLTRHYGNQVAVGQLTCRIRAGEIIGQLGRNGAGKTTNMKMLTGALEPDSGRVLNDGLDMASNEPSGQARHTSGDARAATDIDNALSMAVSLLRARQKIGVR